MTKTFGIAQIHTSGNITVQLEKASKVPESLFWLLLEDKLRQQVKGIEDQMSDSLAQIKEHFSKSGKVAPVIIEDIIFSMAVKK